MCLAPDAIQREGKRTIGGRGKRLGRVGKKL